MFRKLRPMHARSSAYCFLLASFLAGVAELSCRAQAAGGAAASAVLESRIDAITSRPQLRHSHIGVEFYDLETGKLLYGRRQNELFVPGSTTKLLTVGTALQLLMPEYRFRTSVYRTGIIDASGVLHGDLVLVGSGDPNLSARPQPDGTLAYEDTDHAYDDEPGAKAVPGDPLLVLKELAKQVRDSGIKRVVGKLRIDASLFMARDLDLGTQIVISPVVVNDNVVDVTIQPGATAGSPAVISISPDVGLLKINNEMTTQERNTASDVKLRSVQTKEGGLQLTMQGHVALKASPLLRVVKVPDPDLFAQRAMLTCLRASGVDIQDTAFAYSDAAGTRVAYTDSTRVAQHISSPLIAEAKVILKVSQNLHASLLPYVEGAILAHKPNDAAQAGFDLERAVLLKDGLDISGAAQSDGAGGAAFFSPDFMVRYLTYETTLPWFQSFRDALPVLGKDGTLAGIGRDLPSAGHIFAKTGTFDAYDALNRRVIITAKGLAGYIDALNGHHLVFAAYVNFTPVSREDLDAGLPDLGGLLAEIASAAYDLPAAR